MTVANELSKKKELMIFDLKEQMNNFNVNKYEKYEKLPLTELSRNYSTGMLF